MIADSHKYTRQFTNFTCITRDGGSSLIFLPEAVRGIAGIISIIIREEQMLLAVNETMSRSRSFSLVVLFSIRKKRTRSMYFSQILVL